MTTWSAIDSSKAVIRWRLFTARAVRENDPGERARLLRRADAIRCTATGGEDRCTLASGHEGRRHEP